MLYWLLWRNLVLQVSNNNGFPCKCAGWFQILIFLKIFLKDFPRNLNISTIWRTKRRIKLILQFFPLASYKIVEFDRILKFKSNIKREFLIKMFSKPRVHPLIVLLGGLLLLSINFLPFIGFGACIHYNEWALKSLFSLFFYYKRFVWNGGSV